MIDRHLSAGISAGVGTPHHAEKWTFEIAPEVAVSILCHIQYVALLHRRPLASSRILQASGGRVLLLQLHQIGDILKGIRRDITNDAHKGGAKQHTFFVRRVLLFKETNATHLFPFLTSVPERGRSIVRALVYTACLLVVNYCRESNILRGTHANESFKLYTSMTNNELECSASGALEESRLYAPTTYFRDSSPRPPLGLPHAPCLHTGCEKGHKYKDSPTMQNHTHAVQSKRITFDPVRPYV